MQIVRDILQQHAQTTPFALELGVREQENGVVRETGEVDVLIDEVGMVLRIELLHAEGSLRVEAEDPDIRVLDDGQRLRPKQLSSDVVEVGSLKAYRYVELEPMHVEENVDGFWLCEEQR